MTTYYCKCGRIVRKSTDADNTGNRLEGYAPGHECFGCPYVLPFGENRYEEGKGFRLEIKGYECRMSKDIEYASRFSGSVSDKNTCHIVSLDFDFLERVSNWIAENYPGGELNGRFNRSEIRPVEYSSNGRYRLTISCAQNKAGMAAKAALLAQFFNQDGSRKDMTPEQEKEKILNDIKAATHPKQSPPPTAAPSQSPGPGTAHGACTGTIAPGGRKETPDGRKLYFKKTASLVYRFSGTGRFQFWLFSGHQEWKSSDFLNQTYARENRETLNPPSQWLDEYAAAQGWPEITQKEFDAMCKIMNAPTADAVATTAAPAAEPEETLTTSENAADAKISKDWRSGATGAESSSVRHCLAGTAPATQSLSGAAAACLEAEPGRPAFDYSGLDTQTVDTLHMAERQYTQGKKMTETGLRWMVNAVSMAHDALCGAVVQQLDNGKFAPKDDTFRAWCASISLSKSSAYNLLRVADRFGSIQLDGKSILDVQPATLLYEASKPSAPAELVQGVKDGDITTHKQYQELLAQLKSKDDEVAAANARADGLAEEVIAREEKITELLDASEAADRRAEKAEAERDAARKEKAGLAADCNRLGKAASEKDARIRELEARPVEVVGATPADIARWRAEGAEQARRETQRELRRVSAEAAKERKRAEEAERDRDECADTMEKYATQLGELRGRQEMTDSQLHAIYTAEKAAETCTMVICQALDEICDLPRDLKAQAMEHLLNLCICLRKAVDLGYWPTEEDFEDEPDEWPEEDEDV